MKSKSILQVDNHNILAILILCILPRCICYIYKQKLINLTCNKSVDNFIHNLLLNLAPEELIIIIFKISSVSNSIQHQLVRTCISSAPIATPSNTVAAPVLP